MMQEHRKQANKEGVRAEDSWKSTNAYFEFEKKKH
jgi:hypothetical protein